MKPTPLPVFFAGAFATASMLLGLGSIAHRFDPVSRKAVPTQRFECAELPMPIPQVGGGIDQRARMERPAELAAVA